MKNPMKSRIRNKHIKRSVDELIAQVSELKQALTGDGSLYPAQPAELALNLHKAIVGNWSAVAATWPLARTPNVDIAPDYETPIPSRDNIGRIQGKYNPCVVGTDGSEPDALNKSFISGGIEDMTVVMNISEVMGLPLTKDTVTLDWGVGCGRIARHIPDILKPNLFGADVDPVNIAYCKENMPFGDYTVLDPYSATPYDDDQFDLVYSHSVLTHLAEPDQNHWLQELSRITRGLMVLSVHGPYSVSTAEWSKNPYAVEHYMLQGIVDAPDPNPDIADVTDPEYYRDIGHTPQYIQNHWSKFVEVVEIIPKGFGHVHDAVVCRPK